MLPLYLRRLLQNCPLPLSPRRLAQAASIPLVALCLTPTTRLVAQDKAADKAVSAAVQAVPAVPAIVFRERPKYPTDPQRLRRTPQIDGVLNDGEWDPFYTITDGPIKGTIYCNWDDNYLYLAVRTQQPATILFDIDMGGDGWLRSADNLELVVGNVPESGTPAVVARLLDAANSKDTPAWNEKAVDPKNLLCAGKIVNGSQIIEIAIPKNTASLVLRTGVNIGLRAEFLPPMPPESYTPTQPFEPHLLLDASLVEARAQAASGINPYLTLSDNKCIAGQKLFATLELRNQTDSVVPIRSVFWTGPGNSLNAVTSIREVTVPSIPSQKTLKLKYRTELPPGLSVGSYMLQVTVELANGKQVQAAATFSVVEPVQAQMSSDPQPLTIVGQTKLSVAVDVFSAVPNHLGADVELTVLPAGWELEGGRKRGVSIDREDAHKITRFNMKLPSTTPPGDYPFEATVTWKNRVWKVQHIVHVVTQEVLKK